MGIVRAETIARMRGAFREGLSTSQFIADMRKIGLSYRRSDMLADWRSINQLETKKGLMRYVRRDRYPAVKVLAAVEWEISKEYMYKVKVWSATADLVPVPPHFVNVMSDVPLTPEMVEAEVESQWGEWERYKGEEIARLQAWTVVRKVMA